MALIRTLSFPTQRWRVVAGLLRYLSSSPQRPCLTTSLRSSTASGESYQVMAADKETIVCYHTPKIVPIQDTKPLRRRKVWERKSLTEEEATVVRKLRQEDEDIWSIHTLSRLFKTSPTVISRVAPSSVERQRQLEEERELLKQMRPHKRKLYLLQRQTTRQNKLKKLMATSKYPFPAPEPSNSQ